MESFEVQGHWWLPNQDEPIAGTLRFTPSDGATLDLMGSFEDPLREGFIVGKTLGKTYPSILGVDVDGKAYTIFSPILQHNRLTIGTATQATTSYFASLVLRGAHYTSQDEVKIRKVSCRFWSLDEWVSLSGIEVKEMNYSPPQITIQYRMPDKLPLDIDSRLRLVIEFSFRGPTLRPVQTSVSMEQKAWLSLETSGDSFRLDEVRDLVEHLQGFLTLGMGEPTYILECDAVLDDVLDEWGKPVKVDLFWLQRFRREHGKTLLPFEMLFTLSDLNDKAGVYIRNWYAQRQNQDLREVFDLYFGALYNPWLYDENRFLAFVQALELYHRIKGSRQYDLPPNEHEKRIESIISQAPKEYRSWLKDQLKFSNELTLRQRLRELWDRHSSILERYFGDRDKFIDKLVKTRNYYVHHDPSRKNEALRGPDLGRMNRSLFLMLCLLCMLDLLRMPPEQVEALLDQRKWLLERLWKAA